MFDSYVLGRQIEQLSRFPVEEKHAAMLKISRKNFEYDFEAN